MPFNSTTASYVLSGRKILMIKNQGRYMYPTLAHCYSTSRTNFSTTIHYGYIRIKHRLLLVLTHWMTDYRLRNNHEAICAEEVLLVVPSWRESFQWSRLGPFQDYWLHHRKVQANRRPSWCTHSVKQRNWNLGVDSHINVLHLTLHLLVKTYMYPGVNTY